MPEVAFPETQVGFYWCVQIPPYPRMSQRQFFALPFARAVLLSISVLILSSASLTCCQSSPGKLLPTASGNKLALFSASPTCVGLVCSFVVFVAQKRKSYVRRHTRTVWFRPELYLSKFNLLVRMFRRSPECPPICNFWL